MMESLEIIDGLIARKDYENAVMECQRVLKNSPNNILVLQKIIPSLIAINNFHDAQKNIDHLLLIEPYNFCAYVYSGEKAFRQGNYEIAQSWLFKSTFINTDERYPYVLLSQIIPSPINRYPPADIVFYSGHPFNEFFYKPNDIELKPLSGTENALLGIVKEFGKKGKKIIVFANVEKTETFCGVKFFPNREFFFYSQNIDIKNLIVTQQTTPFRTKLKAKRVFYWAHDPAQSPLYEGVDFKKLPIYKIITNSQFHFKNWKEYFGMDEDKLFQATNGVDPELFFGISNIKRKKYQLICSSRPSRGWKELIKIFNEVLLTNPGARLILTTYTQKKDFNDDPEIKPYLELSKKNPNIEVLLNLSKKDYYKKLAESYLYVYPNIESHGENSCIAAMEAQYLGTPVITSSNGALPETVQDKKTGIIVPIDESNFFQSFIEAILGLWHDDAEWSAYSQRAHQWISQNYIWEKVVEKWVDGFLRG